MKFASYELAQLLHALSGWESEDFAVDEDDSEVWLYDLGFLLDKLPGHYITLDKELDENSDRDVWTAAYRQDVYTKGYVETGESPEDAVCRLAIRLFQEQVITAD